jgi:NADPH:quinone reductase-like Zn-dependent oxidoreductase
VHEYFRKTVMKAIVCTEFGPPNVLRLNEVDTPSPKNDEILVRIRATPVNYGDTLARNFREVGLRDFNMPAIFWFFAKIFFGFRTPRIRVLGSEFAGVVEATGPDVKRFCKGDEVFGYRGMNMGAYAEYLCITESECVAAKPSTMTFEEAATVPYGAMMALSLLRRAHLKAGQKVLIVGASGGIGSAAVQLSKFHFGAEVTGVCSTPRLDLVRSLGADKVIDYTREDFTQNGETYDLIFDILGKSSFSRCTRSLKRDGIHLFASFKMKQLLQMLWTSIRGGKRVICGLAPGSTEDLIAVRDLVEAGKVKAAVDRCFPLEQTPDAHRYVEEGHKKGSVVIVVETTS